MTILFYAQPYDISAEGFYFSDAKEYAKKSEKLCNRYGDIVEEFEIQFIDGDLIDCELAEAIGINQTNFAQYLNYVDAWEDLEKQTVIIAVGECGYEITRDTSPNDFDVDIYRVDSMQELAEQFVDEGMFGKIPENLQSYIDYEAIARDLNMDYSEAVIGGERLVYRCS